jgi:hypothetical protein
LHVAEISTSKSLILPLIITAVALLTAASIGQTDGQVTTLPSTSEGPTPHELSSNIQSTEIITNGTTDTSRTEGSNNTTVEIRNEKLMSMANITNLRNQEHHYSYSFVSV